MGVLNPRSGCKLRRQGVRTYTGLYVQGRVEGCQFGVLREGRSDQIPGSDANERLQLIGQ